MSCLHHFLSSALSSVMFNFLMTVFFHYLTPGLFWPSNLHLQLHRSPKYAILIPKFDMTTNHLNVVFLIAIFKVIHPTSSSNPVLHLFNMKIEKKTKDRRRHWQSTYIPLLEYRGDIQVSNKKKVLKPKNVMRYSVEG